MEEKFKYQDSLDLFEQIYYTEDGKLKKDDWRENSYDEDSSTYGKFARDKSYEADGRSKLVGRSAFSPRIRRIPAFQTKENAQGRKINTMNFEGYKYVLTLDEQGQFDHHIYGFLSENRVKGNVTEFDITDKSKEEVLGLVREMLSMSNEEIMKRFGIDKIYSDQVKLELLLDDVIQDYLNRTNTQVLSKTYGPEYGIRMETSNGEVNLEHQSSPSIDIYGKDGKNDIIYYELLEGDHLKTDDPLRVKIDEKMTHAETELGNLLLQTLRERFSEKSSQLDGKEGQQTGEVAPLDTDYISDGSEESHPVDETEKNDLNNLSSEELEKILNETLESNNAKAEELEILKKQNLIKRIIKAQEEGKALDAQIRDAKAQITNR